MSPSERLKRLRKVMDVSQRDLAMELKTSYGSIATWEKHGSQIPGPVLKLIDLYEDELGLSKESGHDSELKQIITSRLERSALYSMATLSATTQCLNVFLRQIWTSEKGVSQLRLTAHARIAAQLAERLGNMKGTAVKFAQTLSHFDFALPEGMRETFANVQYSGRSMSERAIADVLAESFGKGPKRLFAEWDPEPLAAASIGQVHRARLKSGEEVAVKIQYPGIRDAIRADLTNLELLDRWFALFMKGQDKGALVRELSRVFLEECDYNVEAANHEKIRSFFSGRPNLIIPRVFHEFSNDRVLTTEFVKGQNIRDFVRTANPDERLRAAKTLFRFFYESMFRFRALQADSNEGNFIFTPNGVALVDFGCVHWYTPETARNWRRQLNHLMRGEYDQLNQLMWQMGFTRQPQSFDFDHLNKSQRSLYEPLIYDREFEFTPEFIHQAWRDFYVDSPNKASGNMPGEWLFPARWVWGFYSLMALFGVRANWHREVRDLIFYETDQDEME